MNEIDLAKFHEVCDSRYEVEWGRLLVSYHWIWYLLATLSPILLVGYSILISSVHHSTPVIIVATSGITILSIMTVSFMIKNFYTMIWLHGGEMNYYALLKDDPRGCEKDKKECESRNTTAKISVEEKTRYAIYCITGECIIIFLCALPCRMS